jgi:N6-L-threonylcarbamoyladenine synthase
MLGKDSLDFSFSGIKTAVLYHVHGPGKTSGGLARMNAQDVADTCASFQAAVVEVLVAKAMMAIERTGIRTVVVGGGVAANRVLRDSLLAACDQHNARLILTPMRYCTDNGAMIAAMGGYMFEAGKLETLALEARATGEI